MPEARDWEGRSLSAYRRNLLLLTPDNPAAGANLTLSLPPAVFTVLTSVQFALTTSSTVASRYANVDYRFARGGNVIRNAATVLVLASTTSQVFQFDNAHTVSEWNTGTAVYAPLSAFQIPQGWDVRITIDAIDTTDQIASVKVTGWSYLRPRDEN